MTLRTISYCLVLGAAVGANAVGCGGDTSDDNTGNNADDSGSDAPAVVPTGNGPDASTSEDASSSDVASGGAGGSGPGNCDMTALGCKGADVAGFSLQPCCATDTACGIDIPAAIASLAPGIPTGCQNPNALVGDAGPDRCIDAPDGAPCIQVDSACEGAAVAGIFQLPGCCRPDNTCGASTHQLHDNKSLPIPLDVPLQCATTQDITDFLASAGVGDIITAPEVPHGPCTYTGEGTVDGGTETGVIDSSPDVIPEAGTDSPAETGADAPGEAAPDAAGDAAAG